MVLCGCVWSFCVSAVVAVCLLISSAVASSPGSVSFIHSKSAEHWDLNPKLLGAVISCSLPSPLKTTTTVPLSVILFFLWETVIVSGCQHINSTHWCQPRTTWRNQKETKLKCCATERFITLLHSFLFCLCGAYSDSTNSCVLVRLYNIRLLPKIQIIKQCICQHTKTRLGSV